MRAFRAVVLIAAAALLFSQANWWEKQRGSGISLKKARQFFPGAVRLQLRDPERGLYYAVDARGDTVGCLLLTSPQTDHIIGYSGPNNLLVALDQRGVIAGVELVQSGDTPEHIGKIIHDAKFLKSFVGWKPSERVPPKVAAVSGATLSSFAIAESIQQRLAGAAPSLRFPDPVTLAEVQTIFPDAATTVPDEARLRVLDRSGRVLGFAVRTSPHADNIAGYRGPTECLVALKPDGETVQAVRLRKSYDTDSYVNQIRGADAFLSLFAGRKISELSEFEFDKERIDGISGATQTARAVAAGIKTHFGAESRRPAAARWRPRPQDWALAGVIVGALIMAFTPLRGSRVARVCWQLFLVGYVGLISHDLLSLALLGGWASHGLALKAAPGLVLLALAALVVPWGTRRQLYCHQICPHGAAQQLLGKFSKRRWPVPHRVAQYLEWIPPALLVAAFFLLLTGQSISLAQLEPFDAWVWGAAGTVTVVLAVTGLVASIFVPQAYCRFGCPTGALLNFARSTGSTEHWSKRDWLALAILALSLCTVAGIRTWPPVEPEPEPTRLNGQAMGTTWSLKIRDEVADQALLHKAVAAEFEWAESLTSHWRPQTDLSQFNRSASTNEMPVPWPVVTLARWSSEISQQTDGAFDITVGPLVNLWGFGPGKPRSSPPTDAEIQAVLPAIGWQKLEVTDHMMRKQHPDMQVDLSSIAEGWVLDQVVALLERRGYTNFLAEVGGELVARGAWTVAIEHPTRTCTISNEAISTSGTYRKKFDAQGKRYSHLIDPRTGYPVTHNTVEVTVRYPDCGRGDAWSTALNVMGVETGLPLAEKLKIAAQFVIEHPDGRLEVRQSTAWK